MIVQAPDIGSVHWSHFVHFPVKGPSRISIILVYVDAFAQYDFSGMGPFLFGALMAMREFLISINLNEALNSNSHGWAGWGVHSVRENNGSPFCHWRMPSLQRLHCV